MTQQFNRFPPAVPDSASIGIAPTLPEIAALCGLCAFYEIAFAFFGADAYVPTGLAGPLILVAALGYGCWQMLRADRRSIWTPLFWFRLSTSAYFGFGTYSVFVVNGVTRVYMETFHRFYDDEVFRLNRLVALSVVLVLITARIVVQVRMRSNRAAQESLDPETMERAIDRLRIVGLVFLGLGTFVTFAIKIPYDFGWITYEWPGSIVNLSRMTMLSIFMLTLWCLERSPKHLPFVGLLTCIELVTQLILFTKSGVLITLVMFLLAFVWHRTNVLRMTAIAVALVGAFLALQPIVTYARDTLEQRYGAATVGFEQRLEILSSYFGSEAAVDNSDEVGRGWTRISYVNAATFVIRQYDIGRPADWPSLLPAVFVPRLFWPEKPIMSDVGVDIYELGTGRRTSAMGAGLFADAYWAMGWLGVLVYLPVYGAILGGFTVMTLGLLRQGLWHYFPVILTAMLMGFRTDGHYLTDVAGASVILCGMYAVITVLDFFIRGKAASPPQNRPAPFADSPSSALHIRHRDPGARHQAQMAPRRPSPPGPGQRNGF